MRTTRTQQSLERDDQLGILTPRPLLPNIRRRPGRRFLLPGRLHLPMSFGYVAWVAFLVFWLLFGRVMVVFYMTTHVISATRGLALDVRPELSRSDLDQFIMALGKLAEAAKAGDKARFEGAPHFAPRRRLDETAAARNPKLRWLPDNSG